MKRKFLVLVIASVVAAFLLSACPRVKPKVGLRKDDRSANLDAYWSAQLDLEKKESGNIAKIIKSAGVVEGQTVAVAYAGAGYLVAPLAKAVGPKGIVYVSDTDAAIIEKIKQRVAEEGLTNVKFVAAKPEDPQIPYDAADVAFVMNAQRYVDLPHAFFDNIRRGIKTGGKLVVIDWESKDPNAPQRKLRRPKKQIIEILEGMGFTLSAHYDYLPNQYFLIFRVMERYGQARQLWNI